VIHTNEDWLVCAQEEWVAAFKPKDYSHKFFMVGIIVPLCFLEAVGVEGNGVYAIIKLLRNDHSQSIA
jgi:hypothetical protein